MAYFDAHNVEYSDTSTIKKAPVELTGSYSVPEGVTTILANAFKNCEQLISIYLPSTLTNVGTSAFNKCNKLSKIYFAGTIDQWFNIEFNSTFDCAFELYIQGMLITELVIPSHITHIRENAFYYCNSLKKVLFHGNIKEIGASAFNKSGISGVLTIPEGVEKIKQLAFFSCSSVTTVELPSTINTIWYGVFGCCYKLQSFKVASNNSIYKTNDDGLLYDNQGVLRAIAPCATDNPVEIPDFITNICSDTFCYSAVPSGGVILNKSIKKINNNAFLKVEGLEIRVPVGTFSYFKELGVPEDCMSEMFNYKTAFLPGHTSISAIVDNPFRILGVYSNATLKEIRSNANRIKRFIEVGRAIDFPTDMNSFLPPVDRTLESVDSALSILTDPKEKFKSSLFWFVKYDDIDSIGMDQFLAGNYPKAIEVFSKRDNWHSSINLSVVAFLQKRFGDAVSFITQSINDCSYQDIATNICGSEFEIDENASAKIFIDALLNDIKIPECRALFRDKGVRLEDDEYLDRCLSTKYSTLINDAIAVAKSVDANEPEDSYDAAIKLIEDTEGALAEYESYVGKEDADFVRISDRLANQILQCGINFYNNSEDEDKLEDAMEIQKKALDIAIGKMTKDRCQQNYDILLKHQKELPPKEVRTECKAIFKELEKYNNLPDKIVHAINLLNNTKPMLDSMKSILGATHEFYLKISTLIVSNAIHNVIEEVNECQKEDVIEFNGVKIPITASMMTNEQKQRKLNSIKSTLREAWRATALMDQFDMETQFKSGRYTPNRDTLKSMCQQFNISTYIPSPSRGNSKPTSTTSKTSSSTTSKTKPSESIVAWIICIIIVEVIWGLIFVDSEGFWMGVLYSLMGWFILPINYGVTWLMLFLADKINE